MIMTALAVASAVGAVSSVIGGAKADKAEAEAERANAAFFREQADFAKWKTDRDLENFEEELDVILGQQRGVFAKSGIKLSGTALEIQERTQDRGEEQMADIRKEGAFNVRLAMLRSQRSGKIAGDMDSARTLNAVGGMARGASSIIANEIRYGGAS